MKKICLVAGARPNFMKIAPIVRALDQRSDVFNHFIVHTGQHYDNEMSGVFFEQLGIPAPAYFLEAGGGSHAQQTAKIMVAFETACLKAQPDLVLVVGDVNSTLACALVAKKLGIRVAHVEAGLRSGDHRMPEEINRLATDAISDLFFVTEPSGRNNLLAEGKPESSIFFVGHVMIDNLFFQLQKLKQGATVSNLAKELAAAHPRYGLVTLHRPSNVDDPARLAEVVAALNQVAEKLPLIFSVHPRTAGRIDEMGLGLSQRITLLPPQPYLDFLYLMKDATVVITDSGGLQEETTGIGIPCITLRENTERPVTVDEGTNTLVRCDDGSLHAAIKLILDGRGKSGRCPVLWDGKAAERICEVLAS